MNKNTPPTHDPSEYLLSEMERLREEAWEAQGLINAMRDQIGVLTRERDEWESNAKTVQEELAEAREVTDEKVHQAAFVLARRLEVHPAMLGHNFAPDARAALTAALGGGDDA